jgi:catecholate siderophore receptor
MIGKRVAPSSSQYIATRPIYVTRTAEACSIALAAMAGFTIAAVSPLANAQDVVPQVEVSAKLDSRYMVKQSATATKTDTDLRDTPQSISVVTNDQVRDQAAQGLAEALRYVPGVGFAHGEGNRETPIFRGVATTADFFIDGIRDDVQYYRDLYNIERVEVFRGPNAMIFGRGATGGLINRVSKVPAWTPAYEASLTLGSDSNRRATFDINQPITQDLAFRLNGLHEDSESYRDGVTLKRSGLNPTLSWRPTSKTVVTLGYEYFKDDRIADRGVSSFRGAPLDTSPSTFFGNAAASPTGTDLNAATALVEHSFDNGVLLRNRSRWSDQDKFYQNVFPGAVNAAGTSVSIAAYNNATSRRGVFNQTDVIFPFVTGQFKHKVLVGTEIGQQDTDNFRNTGYFPGDAGSVTVPVSNPVTSVPVTFRQSATDADNSGQASVRAIYVQAQVELNSQFHVVAGLRYDDFEVDFKNNRTGQTFKSTDGLVSPRIGVIYRPMEPLSLYANYSIAYQPRAGEQLSSLSLTNAALEPEKFKNVELGVKWDVTRNLAAAAAIYRLDRTNVVVLDPTDPTNTRSMLSDGQRSEGLELSLVGNITPAWSVTGSYTYADARFVANTSATQRAGGEVALVPKHAFAMWNRYDFTPVVGAALGLTHRAKVFAANEQIATAATPIPNVTLPSYTRVDAALFFKLNKNLQAQINVENLFDEKYFATAHSNNNIMPGSPRAMRVGLNAVF